jgi:hypothetical protein
MPPWQHSSLTKLLAQILSKQSFLLTSLRKSLAQVLLKQSFLPTFLPKRSLAQTVTHP